MKVLIVEDEPAMVKRLCQQLNGLDPRIETVSAMSRSSGISAVQDDEFDFIICDLRIPPKDGGVDVDEEHGRAVQALAREHCPGTPCLFFTGYATNRNVSEQLSSGGTHDILGTGNPYPMTQLLTKDEFLNCIRLLSEFNSELSALSAISIDYFGSEGSLDKMEKRALRLFARPLQGKSVEARPLSGLSGARTLRARVFNDKGHLVASQFVKIDKREKVREEQKNYQQHVEPLLGVGRFPALGRHIVAGIGKREALCYQLADDYTESLFDVLGVSDREATDVVELLREICNPWLDSRNERLLSLRELREERIGKAELRPFLDALGPIKSLEEIERQVKTSCQHGDLHGFNVLCNPSGGAVVIDFGNVGPAPACLDPVVLELSVLFHNESPFCNNSWPTIEQTEEWFDVDEYVRDCPAPKFIRKCREWASETGGVSGLPLVVYTEAIRQLKYKDTNHDRALAIARAAIREIT